MKIVVKLVVVLILAVATAALFFSPDGQEITADLDREVFPMFSATIATVVWVVLLLLLFRKKKETS